MSNKPAKLVSADFRFLKSISGNPKVLARLSQSVSIIAKKKSKFWRVKARYFLCLLFDFLLHNYEKGVAAKRSTISIIFPFGELKRHSRFLDVFVVCFFFLVLKMFFFFSLVLIIEIQIILFEFRELDDGVRALPSERIIREVEQRQVETIAQ